MSKIRGQGPPVADEGRRRRRPTGRGGRAGRRRSSGRQWAEGHSGDYQREDADEPTEWELSREAAAASFTRILAAGTASWPEWPHIDQLFVRAFATMPGPAGTQAASMQGPVMLVIATAAGCPPISTFGMPTTMVNGMAG